MTWIKKMMNRIFESEKVEEVEDLEEKLDVRHTEDKTNETSQERPAFRFPIITDAEIYGWEPDENEMQNKTEELVKELNDDGFEPVPLYQNDRWPVQNEKVNIHRATSKTKYVEEKPFRHNIRTRVEEKQEVVKNDDRSSIIKKRNNRPFTPTVVPSPVYGYQRPATKPKPSFNHIETNKEEQLSNIIEEQELYPAQIDAETDWNEFGNPTESPVELEEITRIEPDDYVHTTTENQFESNDVFERRTYSNAVTDEPHETEIPEDQFHQTEVQVEEVQMQEVSENPDAMNSTNVDTEQSIESSILSRIAEPEDISVSEEEEMPNEILSEPATEEVEGLSDPIHAKKESIVPFNVLMLKNDKQKYEKRIQDQEPEKNLATESLVGDEQTAGTVQVTSQLVEVEEEQEMEPYYALPPKDFLIQPEEHIEDTEWLQTQSEKLEEALSYFAIQANVIEAVQGPTVTRFELTVGHGTKVSKVRNLTDDLKLALAAEDIRIQAPIPGTSSIGIEIPNRKARAVRISEVIETKRFQESDSPLEAVLGLSLTGEPVTLDLRKMPHGMIAGATGSGKSVCINSILISLLYKSAPTDLKMLLIDPKMVELAPYNGIPHLLSPVITDVKAATAALKWAVGEMERRYELFAHVGARNIERYNEMAEKDRKFSLKLPYLLIVIDELADLMMMAPADVEVSISRITQKARACGIHLIIATQRPSVDVITGTIKANVPTRIAFSVSSQIDSRTIIDTPGAERLLGKGDMLYLGNGQSSAMRLQGTFVTDQEIERIIEHVQNESEPDYLFGQEDLLANIIEEEEVDPLFNEACLFIIKQGSASTSLMQRNFGIGYNRAAKLMDRMEKLGFISEQRGSKAREVFLTDSSFEQFLSGIEKTI